MPQCADCGTIYSKSLNNCPKCGSSRITLMKARQITCPNCDEDNSFSSSNCWNCDCKLNR